MLRQTPDAEKRDIKVDVYTLNGDDYENKDVPSEDLLSMYESIVSFWDDDNTVICIPVSQVEKVVIHVGDIIVEADEEEESEDDSI